MPNFSPSFSAVSIQIQIARRRPGLWARPVPIIGQGLPLQKIFGLAGSIDFLSLNTNLQSRKVIFQGDGGLNGFGPIHFIHDVKIPIQHKGFIAVLDVVKWNLVTAIGFLKSSDPYLAHYTTTSFELPAVIPLRDLFVLPTPTLPGRNIKLQITLFIVFMVHKYRIQVVIEAQSGRQIDNPAIYRNGIDDDSGIFRG